MTAIDRPAVPLTAVPPLLAPRQRTGPPEPLALPVPLAPNATVAPPLSLAPPAPPSAPSAPCDCGTRRPSRAKAWTRATLTFLHDGFIAYGYILAGIPLDARWACWPSCPQPCDGHGTSPYGVTGRR